MDGRIFEKMRFKSGQTVCILYPPEIFGTDRPGSAADASTDLFDFILVFVYGKGEFEQKLTEALSKRAKDGLFWIAYPKGSGKIKTDINRDILWDLSLPFGIHPVSQVSLDETWSAVRFTDNKNGMVYGRPDKNKSR